MSREVSGDTVLTGGTIIDGTGSPRRSADIVVSGDRLRVIEPGTAIESTRTIDVSGRIVAPGFIDVHTHDDNLLFTDPDVTAKTSQGVTTVIVGNCGVSLSPIQFGDRAPPPPLDLLGDASAYRHPTVEAYMAALGETPPAANAGILVGHSTLRLAAMDDVDREAKRPEIDQMRETLAEGMEAGALGFSTGLIYAPNKAATTDEIVAVAEVAGAAGGLYVTHMRNEHNGVEEALEETFEIGRRAGAPVIVSHHKCAGRANHGRSKDTLARIERAQANQKVAIDVYPYTAGSTVIMPEMVPLAERVIITWSDARPDLAGRDLADIATEMGCSLEDAAQKLQPGGAIYFLMAEEDVQRIMQAPYAMIGSDGLPHDAHPHPRLWGTFPRVLGHYARDLGLFTLEDAVHRMTGLPAENFMLEDRGVIREGAFADLVVFDAERIAERGTFENPKTPAAGIDLVMVNGTVIREGGKVTGARPGRALKRQQA